MLTNATLALFILFMKPMQCLVYVVVYEYQAVWHTNDDNDDRGSSLYIASDTDDDVNDAIC